MIRCVEVKNGVVLGCCPDIFGEPALIANGDDIIIVVAQVIRDGILTIVAAYILADQAI